MDEYKGKTLSWLLSGGIVELALDRPPANEIGLAMLEDLERFVSSLPALESKASTLILCSEQKAGFSAGADLRELYEQAQKMDASSAAKGVREFLERIHAVLNRLDTSPLTTIAAVHGVCFGGGFELALTCDLIIADKMARFCFPELRGARSPAHRPQHQCHQGAFGGPREPGRRGRRSPSPGALDCSANN